MPESPAKSVVAKERPRDKFGHFVDIGQDSEGEELVDVKVHNPLKKIYAILESIKKNQEITLSSRFTIPLVAIPIILAVIFGLGGFQLGRLNPVCQPQFTTRIGTLYVIKVVKPVEQSLLNRLVPFLITKTSPTTTTQVILKDGTEIYELSLKFPLSQVISNGSQVAVSGNFNSCTNTINLETPDNISPISY